LISSTSLAAAFSSILDMLEEVQKVMDQDENYKDQVLMTFRKG
jgi:hypothetical protein